jgi:hypothetical protein
MTMSKSHPRIDATAMMKIRKDGRFFQTSILVPLAIALHAVGIILSPGPAMQLELKAKGTVSKGTIPDVRRVVSYSTLPLMAYVRPRMAAKTRTERRVHRTADRMRFANVLHEN